MPVAKKGVGRTSDKRRKEFTEKLGNYERAHGSSAVILSLIEGMQDALVDKGVVTELELINAVEASVKQNAEVRENLRAMRRH